MLRPLTSAAYSQGMEIQPLEKAVKYSQMKTTETIPGQFESGRAPPIPTPLATPKKATAMTAAPIMSSGRRPTLSTKAMDAVVVKKYETALAAATQRARVSDRPTDLWITYGRK
jgi:hypothetical protein